MSDPNPIPRDVNYAVGNTAKMLTPPLLPAGGIVKTVRGGPGTFTDFTAEGVPNRAARRLVLTADVGNWRFKLGKFAAQSFNFATAVDPATDQITINGHGLITGRGPFRLVPDSGGAFNQVPVGTAPRKATGVLTLSGNALNTETVVIAGKTYTFQTILTDVDGNVLIGATASDSIDNLIAAITLGAGAGTLYANSTTLHPTVSARVGAGDTMDAIAKTAGTAGNSLTTTETLTNGLWGAGTLLGGTAAVSYWIIKVDDNNFKLATSRANAYAGTAVDITADGEGTGTIDGSFNMVDVPTADVTDGSGGNRLPEGQSIDLPPDLVVTVKGSASNAVLSYGWAE